MKVGSFDFEGNTVVVKAQDTKNRKPAQLPVRKETAAELKAMFRTKLPTANAFDLPSKYNMADMLRADLAEAQIKPETDEGVVDFHSLRHCTASFLAASGCHPKTAQALLRHSSVDLTLGLYSHSFKDNEIAAIGSVAKVEIASSLHCSQ